MRGALLTLWVSSTVACSVGSPDLAGEVPSSSGGAPAATGGSATVDPGEISFEPSGVLPLDPGARAELAVRVRPARSQLVTFELLSSETQFDGFLLSATAQVDDEGLASVTLQAPSKPSSFLVRASLNSLVEVTREVSVSSTGYGTLSVVPEYPGKREIQTWTASARVGVTCEEVEDLWQDGPLLASSETTPVLDLVPADVTVTIVLRGDQLVSGCTTITDLGQEEERELSVPVSDRPLAFDSGVLELSLGMEETTLTFANHLAQSIEEGMQTWRESDPSDEAERLLAAMVDKIEDERDAAAFAASADEADFVAAIKAAWLSPSPFSESLVAQLTQAADSIPATDSFVGVLNLNPDEQRFTLTEAGGIDAAAGGFESNEWTVKRESGDVLTVGGELSYFPLRWLMALVESKQGTEALVDAALCPEVSESLQSAAQGNALPGCDETCLETLCVEAGLALVDDFDRHGTRAGLLVSARGMVGLSAEAQISELAGSWIGKLHADDPEPAPPEEDTESAVRGPLVGHAVETTP